MIRGRLPARAADGSRPEIPLGIGDENWLNAHLIGPIASQALTSCVHYGGQTRTVPSGCGGNGYCVGKLVSLSIRVSIFYR
jgi:hypothetical protein